MNAAIKRTVPARSQWLMSIILATQEAVIRRIMTQDQFQAQNKTLS
jgi:hypothetical protein